ncbi:hypothetical protein FRC00_008342 [Tulasnella sp. 408]|nr:hypothetical protein FRC00_008342 [Tulasnella sp. 408]
MLDGPAHSLVLCRNPLSLPGLVATSPSSSPARRHHSDYAHCTDAHCQLSAIALLRLTALAYYGVRSLLGVIYQGAVRDDRGHPASSNTTLSCLKDIDQRDPNAIDTYPQHSQSINNTMTNRDSSHLALSDPRRSRSSTKSDRHGFISGGAGMPFAMRFADSPSSPLTTEGSEDVSSYRMEFNWPSNPSMSNVVTGSVERGHDIFAVPITRETLSTTHQLQYPQTFGSSSTLVDQFLPPATINIPRTSAMTGNDCRVVEREYASAGNKAEPLPSDAPILSTPVPLRNARRSKGLAGGRAHLRTRRQVHAVGS